MNNHKRKHVFSTMIDEELDMAQILDPLNDHAKRTHVARVIKILDCLTIVAKGGSGDDQIKAFTLLREYLSRYTWTQYIAHTREGLRVITLIGGRRQWSTDETWEHFAVGKLLELVPSMGGQPRTRRCENPTCQKWFFASKRIDQRFCGGICKQAVFDSDPGRRATKNEKMRTHRAAEKARSMTAKKRVCFAEGKTKSLCKRPVCR